MTKEKILNIIKVLAGFGILLAIYLLYQQVVQDPNAPCNITKTVNCDAIITGPVSKTLGIPTPLYGLIGYVVILFAAFKKNSKLILGMATFGLLFCLRIAYIELFELYTICPVCIACQIIMISVFLLSITINFRKSKE